MWRCPKCGSKVDDEFEVCWACGTTPEGVEDPSFATADEAEPIDDPLDGLGAPADDPLADFAGTPLPELVECYTAANTIEARFVADQLASQGIPALADRQDINLALGGFRPSLWGYGPKVRVRPQDLPKAQAWLDDYARRRASKRSE